MGKQSRKKTKINQTLQSAPLSNEPKPETLQVVPQPENETEAMPGRKTVVLRLPLPLWERLVRSAESAGVSANAFACMTLWLHT